MISIRVKQVTIVKPVSHPCGTVDVLSDVGTVTDVDISVEELLVDLWVLADVLISILPITVVDIGIDMLVGVEIIVMLASAVIASEFAVPVPYAVDVLVDVRLDTLTTVYTGGKIIMVSGITFDMLADADIDVFTDVMIALKLIVPASLADSVRFC